MRTPPPTSVSARIRLCGALTFELGAARSSCDGFRPDRYDIAGAAVCLVGVVLIMYAPRG